MRPLADRFERNWEMKGWSRPGDHVVVACSGGLDSLVLLHLLRFRAKKLGIQLAAAHFDHGMRQESSADASWLHGLTSAWGVPLRTEQALDVPRNEAGARALRYQFLESLTRDGAFARVLTAHHADDQVETVLFRILRGTGVEGLRGIPESRVPGVIRPLLPFARAELEAYARSHRLCSRVDPSNASRRFARNRLRHDVLPMLEQAHPGARDALLRLSRNAERTLDALGSLLDLQLQGVAEGWGADEVFIDRALLRKYSDPVVAALARRAAAHLGVALSEAGTGLAVEFMREGASGTGLDLPGSVRLEREFERFRIARPARPATHTGESGAENDRLEILVPGKGEGELCLSGRRYRVRWGLGGGATAGKAVSAAGWVSAAFPPDRLSFPLRVRGWRPGDRIRIRDGHKKLKKVFRESQVPRGQRDRLPVLVDSEGLVVWLPGRFPSAEDGQMADEAGWAVEFRDLGGQ